MKTLIFTVMLAALTAGFAQAGGYGYQSCANNNSKACRDARDAFARHHGGAYPEQYQNHAYNNYNNYNNNRYWNDRDEDRGHERRHEHHHDRDHDGD
jgi:hypothetical protein